MARDHEIKIRLSTDEHQNLLDRSGGEALAKWMREYCLGAELNKPKKSRRPPPKADPELIRHIAIIGNNLNQLARRVNSVGIDNSVELLVQMASVEKALSVLLEAFSDDR